jgi:alkyl sulfatase BDS1-like metallo-beta-lactamase superfamily hydrolase
LSQIRDKYSVAVQIEKAVKSDGSTLHINKSDLREALIGRTAAAELFGSGRASIEGNQSCLQEIVAVLDDFDPAFEILCLFPSLRL